MANSACYSIHKATRNYTRNHGDRDAAHESTRLLPEDDEEAGFSGTLDANPNNRLATSLPKAQLGALIAVRIVDTIAYQQILPYINQMLVALRIAKPEQVGFYSGIVESAYSLAQVFSVYQWGQLSDIIGRRPVVFIGLIGIAVTTMAFGLSISFVGIVASRFLCGLAAGNVAVINAILVEITDDTNQDLAVPIYTLAWPVGAIIGPLIGGTLENAATWYPQYFSWHIFVEHPYLPPCVASAACALVGVVLGYVFIKETLPSKRNSTQAIVHTPTTSESHTDPALGEVEPTNMLALLKTPAMRALTISGFALSFLSLAFDVVFTLFCYTPVDAGGLGLEPATIGNALASAGMLAVVLRFFMMPYILRRFDHALTYNVCMYIWPAAFGLLPLLNILARAHPTSSLNAPSAAAGSPSMFIWIGILTLLALSKIGGLPHSLSILLIKRYAPSPGALGRCNGLVQFAMCVGSAIAPIAVSTLFTGMNGFGWVRRWGLGWMWAALMVGGAIGGARVTRGIGPGKGGESG